MAKQIFKIEGLSELKTALAELPKATSTNVLKRALVNAGQPIANDGEARAPRLSGKLADSYTVTTKLSKSQKKQNKKESKVEVYVGPTPHPKSVQTEFGNVHQAAQPHLRPAWDANKNAALESIRDEIAIEIEKARKRLARKAEREAARMKV